MARPPFQFGLKAIFLAVTVVAVTLGTWPYLPFSLAVFLFIWVAVVAIGNLLERLVGRLQRFARPGA